MVQRLVPVDRIERIIPVDRVDRYGVLNWLDRLVPRDLPPWFVCQPGLRLLVPVEVVAHVAPVTERDPRVPCRRLLGSAGGRLRGRRGRAGGMVDIEETHC